MVLVPSGIKINHKAKKLYNTIKTYFIEDRTTVFFNLYIATFFNSVVYKLYDLLSLSFL